MGTRELPEGGLGSTRPRRPAQLRYPDRIACGSPRRLKDEPRLIAFSFRMLRGIPSCRSRRRKAGDSARSDAIIQGGPREADRRRDQPGWITTYPERGESNRLRGSLLTHLMRPQHPGPRSAWGSDESLIVPPGVYIWEKSGDTIYIYVGSGEPNSRSAWHRFEVTLATAGQSGCGYSGIRLSPNPAILTSQCAAPPAR